MHGRLFRGPAILSRGFAGRVLIVAGCSVARAKEPVRCPPEIPNLDGVAEPRRSDLEHHRSSRDREAYEGRAGSEIPPGCVGGGRLAERVASPRRHGLGTHVGWQAAFGTRGPILLPPGSARVAAAPRVAQCS